MAVGRKQHGDAEQREKVADHDALLALRRIDRGDKAKTELLGDHGARHLQRGQRHPRGRAKHDPDQDLVEHHHQKGRHRSHVDVIIGAV